MDLYQVKIRYLAKSMYTWMLHIYVIAEIKGMLKQKRLFICMRNYSDV